MKERVVVPLLVAAAFLLQNVLIPLVLKGDVALAADTVAWLAVAAGSLLVSSRPGAEFWQRDWPLIGLAALVAFFQIFLGVFAGFFVGFALPSWNWSTIALTVQLPFLLVALVGTEMSRAALALGLGSRSSTQRLLLVSVFYAALTPTVSMYLDATTPAAAAEFVVRAMIPALAFSILATYFAYLGGFFCNFTLMGGMAAFNWFSPVLPDITWMVSSLISVMVAAFGFMMLDRAVKPFPSHRLVRGRKEKSHVPYIMALAVVGLLGVWSSVGFLGFTPSIVASGSMSPSLRPGDIAFVVKAPVESLRVGDVIQYVTGSGMVIVHRLVQIEGTPGHLVLVTKGDANSAPDDPIIESQVIGKVVFSLPYLGWASFYLKEAFSSMLSFVEANFLPFAAALFAAVTGGAIWWRKERNDPVRRLRKGLAI